MIASLRSRALAPLVALLLAPALHGQTWSKLFSWTVQSFANRAVLVREAPNGDVVVLASGWDVGTRIARLDAAGQWISSSFVDAYVVDLEMLANGDMVLCGAVGGPPHPKAWIGVFDSAGVPSWQWRSSAADGPSELSLLRAVQPTMDGGFVACGTRAHEFFEKGEPFYNLELSMYRLDANGTILWDGAIGDANTTFLIGYDVTELSDGSFRFVGRNLSGLLEGKVSSGGQLERFQQVATDRAEQPKLARLGGDNVVIVGGNSGTDEGHVLCLDPDANVVWEHRHSLPWALSNQDSARTVRATADGGCLVGIVGAGLGPSIGGPWLVKLDAAGQFEWDATFGNDQGAHVEDLDVTSSGDILVAAATKVGIFSRVQLVRVDDRGRSATCPGITPFGMQTAPTPTTLAPLSDPMLPIGDLPVPMSIGFVPDAEVPVDYCVSITVGTRYCDPAIPNSSGASAEIWVAGSSVLADNDVTLIADDLPSGKTGYFLTGQGTGTVLPPGAQGTLCLIGGPISRYRAQAMSSGPAGRIELSIDLFAIPGHGAAQVGETWNFQAWFRDTNPTSTSNFTDAVGVTVQ